MSFSVKQLLRSAPQDVTGWVCVVIYYVRQQPDYPEHAHRLSFLSIPELLRCSGSCFFHFLSLTPLTLCIHFSSECSGLPLCLQYRSFLLFFFSFFLESGAQWGVITCETKTCHSEGSWGHCWLYSLLLRLWLITISFHFLFHSQITSI